MLNDGGHRGLTSQEAARLLEEHGRNELPQPKSSIWRLAARQLNNVLVYILLVALGLSVAIGIAEGRDGIEPFIDAIVIGAILVLNFLFGFFQEFAAERSIAALRKMSASQATVRRDGVARQVPAAELVPGDIVIVEAGARIPADCKLLAARNVRVDESALTGESDEVRKNTEPTEVDLPMAERRDWIFAGSLMTRGMAEAEVVATGLRTEVGKIAEAVGSTEIPETPLQKRLEKLGRMLGGAVLLVTMIVVLVGIFRDMPVLEVLLVGVSLAVSAVPEGLPAVVTICFALGVRRMARKHALVRRLDALETLGSVTVICTDKTGTLTENRMTVVQTWLAPGADERELADVAASCNHAELPDTGEPTELALLRWADSRTTRRPIDEEEIPFTSESRCMRTRHGARSFIKGAPEVLAEQCDAEEAAEMHAQLRKFGAEGLRVLAAAIVEDDDFRLIGLWGMEDPPRQGVREAIEAARRAGVRTVMITGDAPDTAGAIAADVGIATQQVVTGAELDALGETERAELIMKTSVFARVEPLHKLEILQTLEDAGEVVAMTGDGVNDAPALRGSHVGVAMGLRGTDVARGAASIVLADDHYATIVSAIGEGRRIHDNIRRFVLYLLRANFDELLLIFAAFAVGLPLPLLPVHILWINLLTDGLPALALATEEAEPDVMDRPPRPRDHGLLQGEWGRLAWAALIAFGSALGYFLYHYQAGVEIAEVRTGTLTFAVVFEVLLAFSSRSRLPIWRTNPLSNRWLLVSAAVVLGAQLVLLYTPAGVAFHLVPLPVSAWAIILPLAAVGIATVELGKAKVKSATDRSS